MFNEKFAELLGPSFGFALMLSIWVIDVSSIIEVN